ncbi:unnamed protein product [Rotaria magnacalcarata]|uniref:Uncharacterized protein n=2 Tax=Rotaria magnacalcarata TaxID=392030 RepID=A0A815BFJ9_9BILA|nr:unnamed protein product [Rotaria magnacalcarata]CAF1920832.1 unnamed protein product [Rotaria magnacalcarata]CAF4337761.1 unnamed protein product [Rotaria magnacalcarata]CAF5196766.1 unnamed protein product [Rotaria magnacalcarata]
MSQAHKETIEKFTSTVNARHVNHLNEVLAENVEKIENHKVVYNNIKEAREYYSMEHEAHPSVNYKILKYDDHDEHNHTLKATVVYNNHQYETTYTFSSDGKIQKINSLLIQQDN